MLLWWFTCVSKSQLAPDHEATGLHRVLSTRVFVVVSPETGLGTPNEHRLNVLSKPCRGTAFESIFAGHEVIARKSSTYAIGRPSNVLDRLGRRNISRPRLRSLRSLVEFR